MCLLIAMPSGVTVDSQRLLDSAISNPHGFGYAIVTEKGILRRRDMNVTRLVKRFEKDRARHDGPALFHSRYATHGVKSKANCHPFEVGSTKTVMGHNGMLNVTIPSGDSRSDSRIVAEDMLAKQPAGWLDDKNFMEFLSDFARGSKLVFLTTDPQFKQQMYIVNEGSGSWDADGAWYSNDSWDVSDAWWAKYDTDEDTCSSCELHFLKKETHYYFPGDEDLEFCKGCADFIVKYDIDISEYRAGVGGSYTNNDGELVCTDCDMSSDSCLCWMPSTRKGEPMALTSNPFDPF